MTRGWPWSEKHGCGFRAPKADRLVTDRPQRVNFSESIIRLVDLWAVRSMMEVGIKYLQAFTSSVTINLARDDSSWMKFLIFIQRKDL